MLKQLEQSEFTEGSLGEYFVFEGLVYFLDRYQLFALSFALLVPGCNDDAVSALAD